MQVGISPSNVDQPALVRDDLIRRLSARYLMVLMAVVALVVTNQALIQPLLVRMNDYAPVINVAGRQRMLSQKLAKASLALKAALDDSSRAARRAELREALSEWSSAHQALQHGDAERGIVRLSSTAIDGTWSQLQPHFEAMREAAEFLGRDPMEAAEDVSTALAAIAAHDPMFLSTMDRLVSLMETQSAAELHRLRLLALAIAGTIVALVSALGWFVIHPATRAIRGQVDHLETLVAHRTRELNEMLAALRSEVEERQVMESRNRTLAAQLAHADRVESVGHLAAGLAHELNQPFATIVNYTEACSLALGQPLDDRGQRHLQNLIERVRLASLRAGGIVRRIRNFVRPVATADVMPVELVALVHEVVALCRPEASRAGTSILFQPPTGGEIIVEVDPIQIQQVLVNLIQNAFHALEVVSAQDRRIVLQIKVQPESAQIDVVDNGQGLGDADPDSLFAPFHTTKTDGLGIGLSICRSIIEQHHGTIWAQSLSPQGAHFSFVLPRLQSHAAEYDRQADSVCR
jgi:C4-dicarboxylate-specific signal transduction histidine kinase